METPESLQAELDAQIAEEKRIEEEARIADRQMRMLLDQLKVRANGLTNIGVSVLTLGVIGQFLIYAYSGVPKEFYWPDVALVMFCCLMVCMFLFYEGEDAIRMGYRL